MLEFPRTILVRLFENSRKGLDRVSLAAKNSEKAVPVARFCRFVKPRLESIRNYQTVSVGFSVYKSNLLPSLGAGSPQHHMGLL